jgi:hypothetical protein
VGFEPDTGPDLAWAPAGATPRLLEQQQAELDALLDTMSGWVRLAREIVNPKSKSEIE